ncbi:hypothetical protein K2173_010673 [Erythroxylum novogranatense]|uniref:Peptidyl-prolyl cis-trans isomerase n=1 Tax=Erythroxylum novogranatense TaxID=1862640 RepID=A0AAV8T797_9ROSI|nr:hypothetical protein K2173_010673 [Erythroxylum novogranatense]
MSVLIVTSLGDIVVDLYTDKCPLTSKNFLKLCKIKYYNGCLFHTVQKDFTAQTGDPTGTGAGGDSIYKFLYGDQARFFSDEIHLDLKHTKVGTFYITLRDDLDYLDGKHTVFGEVAEGHETLTRINEAYVDDKNRPYKNIRLTNPIVHFYDWVPMDEQLGPTELDEIVRAKEAHSKVSNDWGHSDLEIKPPDNVLLYLFNPIYKFQSLDSDEDLHTIFSRFVSLYREVIRDYKTGDTLFYAFIEFETKEACEQAYFKMDNALIDDRRIHVDFSQSVSKLWSQFKRKDNQMGKDYPEIPRLERQMDTMIHQIKLRDKDAQKFRGLEHRQQKERCT